MAGTGGELILLQILIILAAAKLGGELAERLKQSSVLGELLVGVLIGPSVFGWIDPHAILPHVGQMAETGLGDHQLGEVLDLNVLRVLAELGVVLLLFEVGLESDLRELVRVGPSALLVGLIGIVVSFAAGYGASWAFAHYGYWPDERLFHVFVGATLTATSVGITARVLADMNRLATDEARIILGAAVFDDIGGLLILAIVAALAAGEGLTAGAIALTIAKAIGFLFVSVGLGILIVPRFVDRLDPLLRTRGATLALGVIFMLGMAYLAGLAGLATIVGAFAGGLILAQSKVHHRIFNDIKPLGAILVPIFFVLLGVQVDLSAIGGRGVAVLVIGVVLSVIAILAKLASGWGVVRSRASRYVVGVGMAPRGEVGLIFALVGLSTGVLANWQYTAIIIVVMVTTFVTPIWLKAIAGRMQVVGPPSEQLEEAADMLRG